MVGHGDESLISAVGDVEPPPLLLLLWKVEAVDGVRHLRLGLEQGPFSPLDALLQRLPLLTGAGEWREEDIFQNNVYYSPRKRNTNQIFVIIIKPDAKVL